MLLLGSLHAPSLVPPAEGWSSRSGACGRRRGLLGSLVTDWFLDKKKSLLEQKSAVSCQGHHPWHDERQGEPKKDWGEEK